MEIVIARTAGMCYGVKRAVEHVRALGSRAVVYGRLIHNNDVLKELKSSGVGMVSRISECPRGKTLIIRSHGIGADEYAEIKASGLAYEDLTCPHVSRIHKIVREMSAPPHSCAVIIAGDPKHPEVRGIVGHVSGVSYTLNALTDIELLLASGDLLRHNALILVAQTTLDVAKWRLYKEFIKKHCTNLQIFDTICNTTTLRQEEAEKLSRECDLMLVMGSPESSNTSKLADICRENAHTICIENAMQLEIDRIRTFKKAGIIAGASTPAEKIEEVHKKMNEELKGNVVDNETPASVKSADDDIDFMAEIDKTFKRVYIGNRVKASVVSVNRTEVVVDIGTKHSGYIPADELSNDSSKLPEEIVKSGDEIECVVTSINDAEGIVYLSKKKVDSALGLEKIADAEASGETLTGTVAAVVKGGVIVVCEGAKVFVPASQSGVPKTGKLEDLQKKTVQFKIIEVNETRGRIVGSIRAATKEVNDARKEAFWASITEGKRFKGEVKSIESYGVFVDLGGVDGMVHLSELTWSRIRHPREVVSVGDKLEVYVKSFDSEKRRVSLGAKDPDANPWTNFVRDYAQGDVVNVEIVSITPFGAFAQILPGIDGLIHISQIAAERVNNIGQLLSPGDKVDAKITDIDEAKNRISLSIRALSEPAEPAGEQGGAPSDEHAVVYSDDEPVSLPADTLEQAETEEE